MKNTTFLKIASLFIFLTFPITTFVSAQTSTELFNENFSGSNTPSSANFSGEDEIASIDWTATKAGYAHKFQRKKGKWEIEECTTASSLVTDPFSIVGYSSFEFSIKIEFSNLEDDFGDTSSDEWVKVFYTIDPTTGGTEQELISLYGDGDNGDFTGKFCDSGSNIILRIEVKHDSDDKHKIDNIKFSGTTDAIPGEPEKLFYEDQSSAIQSGSTITGVGSAMGFCSGRGVNWSMNNPGGDTDVRVHDGDHIHCSELDGATVTWQTEDIIISSFTNLNFSVYIKKAEDLDSSDYIKLKYSLDGGSPQTIATYNNDNIDETTIGGDISEIGDRIKLYIEVYQNEEDEKIEWEDITLTGTSTYKVWLGEDDPNTANDPDTSDDINEKSNWLRNVLPSTTSNIWIPNTKTLLLTDDQVFNSVNTKSGANLTIQKDASLTTTNDFNNQGTVTLNSDATEFASIIVGGTATGEITYNKYINYLAYQEWDLVGSPVLNQNMQSFAQTHTNSSNTGSLAFDDPYYALGEYLTEWGNYSNYTTSTIPNSSFPAGKGFQMATNPIGSGNDMEGQTLAFTGEIATASQSIDVQNLNGTNNGYGRRWNLVANPYPSYISAEAFFATNSSVMGGAYTYCYVWRTGDEEDNNEVNGGFGKWGIYNMLQNNLGGGDFQIAPGQAFYVAAASADVAQIQFTPSMRTVTGGDDFINGAPVLLNYKLDLKLYNGSTERAKTKFHFQQGLTLGLEPAYDAAAYNQAAALSSRLPEDDQGVNFQLNAMSIEAAYNQTIPLVINQQEGQSFRVSISNNTLPEDVNVYLEDTQNGTLTSLKDQDFELVAQEDLSQDGRFYIRFTTESLAINDVLSPSSLTIFKLNTDAFVTITGLSPEMGKTTATLYNMLGMKVREKVLNTSQSAQQISTQGLASGVYIINLKAGDQAVSKKVIIQ
ncbi:T9SS type A sorting domain-containing protein [Flavobacteriaceae bacterium]|nr:T9SS type A sorting domain-containing protein [Flavobacteriaceae bacterium]